MRGASEARIIHECAYANTRLKHDPLCRTWKPEYAIRPGQRLKAKKVQLIICPNEI